MAAQFRVELRGDVVVVHEEGTVEFEEKQRAMAAAIRLALDSGSKRMLFDHRRVDIANYYSHIVRHAELAPGLGLDGAFRIAFVGRPGQEDVMAFSVMVGTNRGWDVQHFFDFDRALEWLRG
jgi:hypothetical protein